MIVLKIDFNLSENYKPIFCTSAAMQSTIPTFQISVQIIYIYLSRTNFGANYL